MFLCRAGSRNKADFWRNNGNLPEVLMRLAGRDLEKESVSSDLRISSSDNAARFLSGLCPSELDEVLIRLVRELIEKRLFDNSRLNGKSYILIVDGSVREKCRRRFDKLGLKRGGARYHYVLRVDILLNGIAIPLIHEHIDMQDPQSEKKIARLMQQDVYSSVSRHTIEDQLNSQKNNGYGLKQPAPYPLTN